MAGPSTGSVHLHAGDHPHTLALLEALVGRRADAASLGFERTEAGAFVDWEQLTGGPLSSTEVACVHLARGCAVLERAGGLPPHLVAAATEALAAVAGPARRPPATRGMAR
ncbi:MAG TPA: hypothetical protein VFJ85_08535 [Acidimicrobiales bacterium]|nr:hypothetical protein [Acidimicrobiales bacterium]